MKQDTENNRQTEQEKPRYIPLTEDNYVDQAEAVIKALKNKKKKNGKLEAVVTTSKIRNLLAMVAEINNQVQHEKSETLSKDAISQINYLRVRFVYESGRESGVKNLVEYGSILEHLKNIKTSKSRFILFSRYMEALVAYRKYLVGYDE